MDAASAKLGSMLPTKRAAIRNRIAAPVRSMLARSGAESALPPTAAAVCIAAFFASFAGRTSFSGGRGGFGTGCCFRGFRCRRCLNIWRRCRWCLGRFRIGLFGARTTLGLGFGFGGGFGLSRNFGGYRFRGGFGSRFDCLFGRSFCIGLFGASTALGLGRFFRFDRSLDRSFHCSFGFRRDVCSNFSIRHLARP